MRYRSLDVSVVQEVAESLIAGHNTAIELRTEDLGDGQSLDEQPLREAVAMFQAELEEGEPDDNETFEGRLAAAIYPWLSQIPVEVLDDRGFWRYLAVRHFWWFIAWREEGPISRGNFMSLVDARTPAEQIPLRLFLRSKAVDHGGDVILSGEIPESTDFWRSHIVRVRVGSAPHIARAFAEAKRDEGDRDIRLSTSALRETAKRVNRTWSNVRLDLYDLEEARIFIESMIGDNG